MSKSTPEKFNALIAKYGHGERVSIGQLLLQLDEIHDMAAKLAVRAERAESHVETLTQQVAAYEKAAGYRTPEESAQVDRIKTNEINVITKEVRGLYVKLAQAEQDRDAARAALMEIRVEAAMGAYNSDGTIGGGLTALGCLDIVSACNAALAASAPQQKEK